MTTAVSSHDRRVLRDLASRLAEIAADPVQEEKIALWKKLCRLERTRPLIRLYDWTGWASNPAVVFDLQCENEELRRVEHSLRFRIYKWEHRRDDSVFEAVHDSPIVINSNGYGIEPDTVRPDYIFGADRFRTVITPDDDPSMMNSPSFSVDWEETNRRHELQADILHGILAVTTNGVRQTWCCPMDFFIGWRGIEQSFVDLIDRPEWVHSWLQAITDYDISMMEQYEKQGLLTLNTSGDPLLMGGTAYTDLLPQPDFDPSRVRMIDMWGTSSTQIFSEVSPAMHEEFALRYEKQFLDRFGLSYYGCCEPLHGKVDIILKHLPNVRKISMSPWVDVATGAAALGNKAVFSYKPNPAIFGGSSWDIDAAEKQLRDTFDKTRNCIVEVTVKDLHNVHGEPRRMSEWVAMAMRVSEEYA